jgi:hypothetical protein
MRFVDEKPETYLFNFQHMGQLLVVAVRGYTAEEAYNRFLLMKTAERRSSVVGALPSDVDTGGPDWPMLRGIAARLAGLFGRPAIF